MALVCLALCYWLVDIQRWRSWTKPILVFGANSITAYVFADFLAITLNHFQTRGLDGSRVSLSQFLYEGYCASWLNPANASLLYALVFVAVCWLAMAILYRRRIFLKI
jgi:predicted acyltransferase